MSLRGLITVGSNQEVEQLRSCCCAFKDGEENASVDFSLQTDIASAARRIFQLGKLVEEANKPQSIQAVNMCPLFQKHNNNHKSRKLPNFPTHLLLFLLLFTWNKTILHSVLVLVTKRPDSKFHFPTAPQTVEMAICENFEQQRNLDLSGTTMLISKIMGFRYVGPTLFLRLGCDSFRSDCHLHPTLLNRNALWIAKRAHNGTGET